jgi:hypothetical protein
MSPTVLGRGGVGSFTMGGTSCGPLTGTAGVAPTLGNEFVPFDATFTLENLSCSGQAVTGVRVNGPELTAADQIVINGDDVTASFSTGVTGGRYEYEIQLDSGAWQNASAFGLSSSLAIA